MSNTVGNRVIHVNADIVFSSATEKFYESHAIIEYHALTRVLSGEMRLVQPDRSYTFFAGDTFLLPRNLPAAVIKGPKDGRPYKSVSIYLKPTRLQDYYMRHEFKATQPYSHKIKTFDKHLLLESFFASLLPYFEMDEVLPDNIISVKVEEAISILRNIDKSTDAVLAYFEKPGKLDIVDFMEKNYMFNLSLEKFGYLTGRSLTTFKKDFQKIFRITPGQWLSQKRLELAHYQIFEKKRKPSDIYFDVGFENLSHFSYAFKKHFGYTPTELTVQKAERKIKD
jgi:AraC family transcriptional regulator, exoenzyme S synthesis regulatory protein ExsA